MLGGQERWLLLPAQVKRESRGSAIQRLGHLRVDLALRLETRAFAGFEKHKLRAEQPDSQEIVDADLLNFLGTAQIGEQRDRDSILGEARQALGSGQGGGGALSVLAGLRELRSLGLGRSQRHPARLAVHEQMHARLDVRRDGEQTGEGRNPQGPCENGGVAVLAALFRHDRRQASSTTSDGSNSRATNTACAGR